MLCCCIHIPLGKISIHMLPPSKIKCFSVAGYQSHYRPEAPGGFQEVKVPRLRDKCPWWYGCQPYALATFTTRKYSWYSFLLQAAQDGGTVVSLMHRPLLRPGNTPGTHFCSRLSRPQGHGAIRRIMSMKNSSDTICNRTGDIPICSTAPEPLCYHGPPSLVMTLKFTGVTLPVYLH